MASTRSAVKKFPRLKTVFIVNPRSGSAAHAVAAVRAFASRHHAEVVFTERARHASELAAAALRNGSELIVAVGGDGTLNEIAGIVTATHATLGLIPCGSGNGLGRHLGIHGSAVRALEILHAGAPRLIDTGLADGHPFFTAAGLGFEAEIAARFNRLTRRGFARYLTTSAQAYFAYNPEPHVIEHQGGRTILRPFTLAISNSDQYGNNACIAPGARVDDGLLDLTAVPPVSVLNGAPLLWRLFRQTLDRSHSVFRLRADRFTIERAAPGPIHTDGEVHFAPARVEFSIRPRSLRIMAPCLPVQPVVSHAT